MSLALISQNTFVRQDRYGRYVEEPLTFTFTDGWCVGTRYCPTYTYACRSKSTRCGALWKPRPSSLTTDLSPRLHVTSPKRSLNYDTAPSFVEDEWRMWKRKGVVRVWSRWRSDRDLSIFLNYRGINPELINYGGNELHLGLLLISLPVPYL